jgi:hypothetical protein
VPTKSEPNSVIKRLNSVGNTIMERYFDSNGLAKYDMDFTNHGNPKTHPKIPHRHDWTWENGRGKRGKAK